MRCSGLVLLLAAALAASGCANHVRYLDVQDERLDTVLVSTEYEVDGGGAKIVSSRVAVEFLRIDHFEDRTERTTIKYEEATPYQAWRELYEVPAGLVSVPLSVAFNFLRVALLFYIPGEMVEGYTSFAFAALNPAMNVQSADRVVRERIDVSDTEMFTESRRVRQPLADSRVEARYDAGAPAPLATDPHGVVRFHLLDAVSPSMGPRPRKLLVWYRARSGNGTGGGHEYFISRDLARRLGQARRPMLVIHGTPADPRALGEAVFAIEWLGFAEYSVRLEDDIVTRNGGDGEFVRAFRDTLDALYEDPPEPPGARRR